MAWLQLFGTALGVISVSSRRGGIFAAANKLFVVAAAAALAGVTGVSGVMSRRGMAAWFGVTGVSHTAASGGA